MQLIVTTESKRERFSYFFCVRAERKRLSRLKGLSRSGHESQFIIIIIGLFIIHVEQTNVSLNRAMNHHVK